MPFIRSSDSVNTEALQLSLRSLPQISSIDRIDAVFAVLQQVGEFECYTTSFYYQIIYAIFAVLQQVDEFDWCSSLHCCYVPN